MRYLSTRGRSAPRTFADVLVEGLARDGGLYVPVDGLPDLSVLASGTGGTAPSYVEVAEQVLSPFMAETAANAMAGADGVTGANGVTGADGSTGGGAEAGERGTSAAEPAPIPGLAEAIKEAYATFDHPDVCPVVELGDNLFVQELWHGPTLSFKDVALQLVGRLMDAELERRDERRTIVVGTSGDTGPAAIEACVGRDRLDIVVLHPAGRTSDVQRRQMTTVDAPNVGNIAIEGTFDDCQDLVKALFADAPFRDEVGLSAMNSINWARVMAQIVYYVTATATVAPAGGPLSFSVPSGNFGNVLAGWYARTCGVPIEHLVIASNRNDILARWVDSGSLVAEEVVPTISPAMDIQVSSNHERLLFELLGRDGARTAELVTRFRDLGAVEAPQDPTFLAARLDDDETMDEIRLVLDRYGYLADPHTAIGLGAARRLREAGRLDPAAPVVCLSTAHPAKFPEAVEQATGVRPVPPDRLAGVFDRAERYELLPNDLGAVQSFIKGHLQHPR